jgi:hypothetical protein
MHAKDRVCANSGTRPSVSYIAGEAQIVFVVPSFAAGPRAAPGTCPVDQSGVHLKIMRQDFAATSTSRRQILEQLIFVKHIYPIGTALRHFRPNGRISLRDSTRDQMQNCRRTDCVLVSGAWEK